jgi:pyruvate kinase
MHACGKWGKRSIVATHLLESMIENPTPTRAEASDVANAIYEGADAVMLSGETSVGKYPSECVKFLKSIAAKTEKFNTLDYEKNLISSSDWQHIGITAKHLAEQTNADGIIAITRTGETANLVSNAKPKGFPIYTFTNNKSTYTQLSLIGSSKPYLIGRLNNHDKALEKVISILKKEHDTSESLKFILVSGIFSESHAEAIQIINT